MIVSVAIGTSNRNNNFDLTPLAICYRKSLLNVPAFCDGCGAPSTLDQFFKPV